MATPSLPLSEGVGEVVREIKFAGGPRVPLSTEEQYKSDPSDQDQDLVVPGCVPCDVANTYEYGLEIA